MKALFFFLLATCITLSLSACGMYGALYIPKKTSSGPVMKVKTNPQLQAANLVGQV